MTEPPFALPVAWFELDASRRVTRVGAHLVALLQRPAEELLGAPLDALLLRADRFFLQTHVLPRLDVEGRADEVYLSLRGAGDAPVSVVLNALRVPGDDGPRDCFAAIPMRRRNVFERELDDARTDLARSTQGEREALARVEAVRAQLASAERLATLGELAAAVAHEVSSPLTYILGNLDLLDLHAARREWGDVTAMLAEVRDGATRIRDIVSSLRSLSRVDDTRRVPVDLARALDRALRIAGPEVRRRGRLDVHVATPSPVVLGDEGRIGQVVINLVMNAAHALPAGRAENRIEVTARRLDEARCELVVADNGVGIAPEIQARIFDPFYTTKPVGEGTGLGLSVCHGIVSSLGGSISVESAPGEGARFRVVLPAAPGALSAPSTPAPARPRVLLVVPDDGVSQVMRRALRGCDVTLAASGQAALRQLDEDAAGFALLVSELALPDLSAQALFAQVATRAPALPARTIFLVGGGVDEADRRFLAASGAQTLTRPFGLADLRAALARVGLTPPSSG